MKSIPFIQPWPLVIFLIISGFSAHQPLYHPTVDRISFMLKNTSGHHQMFRVEGPGIAYGFTMNRREMIPCHWPIGAKLYFSSDGERNDSLILTLKAADEGQTLVTGTTPTPPKTLGSPLANEDRLIRFRNNRLKSHKVAIITYKPGETGNGTQIVTLGPYASITQHLPVGTRVYFADDRQVNLVMHGQPLTGNPSLVVGKDDHRKTVNIW